MAALKLIASISLLLGAVGFVYLGWQTYRRMPNRWMKWGIIVTLATWIVLSQHRIINIVIGHKLPTWLLLVFLTAHGIGVILMCGSMLGLWNGHKKGNGH